MTYIKDYLITAADGKQYEVKMYCGVIITTNHLHSGIYIPEDDRRYDVIDSATKAEMGLTSDGAALEYFEKLWDWFHNGGDAEGAVDRPAAHTTRAFDKCGR